MIPIQRSRSIGKDKKLGGPNGRPAEAYLMLKLLFATGAPLKYTVTE